MQAIADWLEKLGMSEYAQRFAENRIDLSVLPDLTDQDLKTSASCSVIGARCCGDRELSGAAPASPEPTPYRAEGPRHRRAPASHGDVADLVGSTALSGAHGP